MQMLEAALPVELKSSQLNKHEISESTFIIYLCIMV
jgi:hypothetical protein